MGKPRKPIAVDWIPLSTPLSFGLISTVVLWSDTHRRVPPVFLLDFINIVVLFLIRSSLQIKSWRKYGWSAWWRKAGCSPVQKLRWVVVWEWCCRYTMRYLRRQTDWVPENFVWETICQTKCAFPVFCGYYDPGVESGQGKLISAWNKTFLIYFPIGRRKTESFRYRAMVLLQ